MALICFFFPQVCGGFNELPDNKSPRSEGNGPQLLQVGAGAVRCVNCSKTAASQMHPSCLQGIASVLNLCSVSPAPAEQHSNESAKNLGEVSPMHDEHFGLGMLELLSCVSLFLMYSLA